jgi:hypothetical protein
MAEPVGLGLRPARRSGLTSPEPVTHPDGPQATPNPSPRTRNHGQAAEQASGRKPTPEQTRKPRRTLTAAPDNGRWIEAKRPGRFPFKRAVTSPRAPTDPG